ncbi:phosphotransferase enzyme family protein [Actinocrinis sp.]|uniref:phosphotransferase enzyme family protein n=1 Tax=Actinocrinis sp. TaxID=1920516 RepID=UPI002B86BC0B|nr:phosphotransferase [Actinocrinis sp.]HXR69482.1 phosphotransferase [Actinocrinis sp.]
MPRHSPLAALLRRYGIADVLGFKPLDEGLLNRAFVVSTGSGRLFLKHYLDQEPHTIRSQHAATAALAARGLPVVAPLTDLSGRTLNRYGSRLFALYPWVDGEHRPGLTFELEQCRALGALLGRLHDALAGILGPAAQPLAQPTTQVAEARAKALRLLDLLNNRPIREGIDDLAEFRLVERLGLLDKLAHRRPTDLAQLTVGHVHGDFHGLNVFHRADGEVCAVVDWDRLGVQPYGEELVRSALILFVDPHDGQLDLARVREYVRGYVDVRPWMADELTAAVHRLWWERLTDFWMLSWRYERQDARTDEQFPAASALVVWWTHHYEKVLDAFCGR